MTLFELNSNLLEENTALKVQFIKRMNLVKKFWSQDDYPCEGLVQIIDYKTLNS